MLFQIVRFHAGRDKILITGRIQIQLMLISSFKMNRAVREIRDIPVLLRSGGIPGTSPHSFATRPSTLFVIAISIINADRAFRNFLRLSASALLTQAIQKTSCHFQICFSGFLQPSHHRQSESHPA